MTAFFKTHWAGLLLSVLLAFLVVAPTLFSVVQLGEGEFTGIYPLRNDDEEHYLTMIREVLDGNYTMGNPYLSIGKKNPYTQPYVADLYYAMLPFLFGISVPLAATINDGLLVGIGSFLLYLLYVRLRIHTFGAVCATLLFFTLFLFQFNRPVNPQLSFVFLMLGLHLIWSIVEHRHSYKKLIAYNVTFSLTFGILFYIYPFYWMTLGVLYAGLTTVACFFDRDIRYWTLSWLSWTLPVCLWCIPFLANLSSLSAHPAVTETFTRNGYIYTRIPSGFLSVTPLFFSIMSIGLLYRFIPRLDWHEGKYFFLACVMVCGGIILHWQNIVTGVALQFTSHFFLITGLFVVSIAALSFQYVYEKPRTIFSYLLMCMVCLPVLFVGFVHRHTITVAFSGVLAPHSIVEDQQRAAVLSWLSGKPRGVVYSLGDEFNRLMTIYTHHDVVFASHAGIFLLPDSEQEERWAAQHFFDSLDTLTINGNREIWIDKYLAIYQTKEVRRKILEFLTRQTYQPHLLMDATVVEKMRALYMTTQKMGFEKVLKKYSVTYVVLDTNETKYAYLTDVYTKASFLTLRYNHNGIYVYSVEY